MEWFEIATLSIMAIVCTTILYCFAKWAKDD